jgi:hypothetical protein
MMDAQRGNAEVSPEAMQARIQQARREAETLKDRIKRKKDELADTTRKYPIAVTNPRGQSFSSSVAATGFMTSRHCSCHPSYRA